MHNDHHLKRLCQDCGIADGYHDIWGTWHETPRETRLALLEALGELPADDDDAQARLEARIDARWQRVMEPVLVWRCDQPPPPLLLHLPAHRMEEGIHWELTEEGGTRHSGQFRVGALPAEDERTLGDETWRAVRLGLDVSAPAGYHHLALRVAGRPLARARVLCAPQRAFRPPALDGDGRVWGAAAQLYALRSGHDWGIGDFTTLGRMVDLWAERGAALVGLNPLHAGFLGNPDHASPYSPSSREFFNTLYLDVEAVPEFADCAEARAMVAAPEFRARIEAARAADLVDYPAVAALKRPVLERLYACFRSRHLAAADARAAAFRDFQREGGDLCPHARHEAGSLPPAGAPATLGRPGGGDLCPHARHETGSLPPAGAPATLGRPGGGGALRRHALFEALWEHFHASLGAWNWRDWPSAYRDADSPEVAAFAESHLHRVEFFEYLQWLAWCQIEAVARRCDERQMPVGLYLDLAVSVDGGGADAWMHRDTFVEGVSVGAPPDDFNLRGQNWGLPPFHPEHLRAAGYAPLIDALRANMRLAGALRIDHIMGLMRLFWIPGDAPAAAGTYMGYRFDEMMAVVLLESVRNHCLVIGEDLGTVPDAVRHAMGEAGLLSYRPLWFEKDWQAGEFKPPQAIDREALAAVTTHDLPSVAGYWEGRDLALRTALRLFDAEEIHLRQEGMRVADRVALLRALGREGLLPAGLSGDDALPPMDEALCRAIHVYLARSAARVMVIQPEDVLLAPDQVNLPGSVSSQYPNWRRRLALPLERWPGHDAFRALTAEVAAARGGIAAASPGEGEAASRLGAGERAPMAPD
ncbi:MAG: 4-alpha-glucanotransferase [Betaproteobacteria bacterium]|nr:4-alpha-glucanotransferase [Betaproteobacteria bacterium]